MTNKNKVDDYYSHLSEKDNNKGEKSKPKGKSKIILKKVKVTKKIDKVPLVKVEKKSTKSTVKSNKPKTKKVLEFTVTKRTDEKKSSKVLKPTLAKKTGNGSGNGSKKPVQKITVVKRGDIVRDTPKTSKITQRGSNAKQANQNFTKPQNFTNNAKKDFKEEERKKPRSLKGTKKTRGRFRFQEEDNTFTRSKVQKSIKKEEKKIEDIKQNLVSHKGETIVIGDFISIKEFSEKTGVLLPKLIAEFMKNGMMVNINSKIDFDSATIISEAFDIKLKKDDSSGANIEDIVIGDISSFLAEDDPSYLVPRAPVVSIMGHVDHGKTSLLDYIRKSKIVSDEAGGITQSIGAYQVELENGKITFLDTPGHEAFTIMRARGAKSTDIAVLVVAADEGVKPQTIESISHAREAGIPIIVAINKMDKEGANPDHVKSQLGEQGLVAEDWGGDIPMIPVSAHSGFGVDELLDIILLVAEMQELKANPNRHGIATVIESNLNSSLGPVATVLINTGTINSGDNIVCSDSHGKVKILRNYLGEKIKFALPSEPVLIVGLDKVVQGGDILQVVNSVDSAKNKASEYKQILEKQKKDGASGLDLLMSKIRAGNLKQLKIILKSDTNGSLEAIKVALIKLSTPETTVSVIHAGVGPITEGDILMGQGSEAILVGFNVGVLTTAKSSLESSKVEFISSDIIYHITERIEKIVTGMLDPKEVEVVLGKAKVLEVFFTEKKFMIVGVNLPDGGKIEKKAKIRVFRNKKYIGAGEVDSIKQGILDVKEVEGPMECGIKFVGKVSLEKKDELEFYKIEIQK